MTRPRLSPDPSILGRLSLLGLLLCLFGAMDGGSIRTEYKVKAGFLTHFVGFTTWPKSSFKDSKSPVRVGVVGKDPFGSYLDKLFAKKKIDGRKVQVCRFKKVDDLEQVHLLFIGELSKEDFGRVIQFCKSRPIHTVGERDDFARKWGVTRIFVSSKDQKVKFQVNRARAEGLKLKLSSKFLKLSRPLDE